MTCSDFLFIFCWILVCPVLLAIYAFVSCVLILFVVVFPGSLWFLVCLCPQSLCTSFPPDFLSGFSLFIFSLHPKYVILCSSSPNTTFSCVFYIAPLLFLFQSLLFPPTEIWHFLLKEHWQQNRQMILIGYYNYRFKPESM